MRQLIKSLAIMAIFATVILPITGCNGSNNSSTPSVAADESLSHHPHKLKDFFLLQPGAGFDSSSNTAVSDQSCLVAADNPANIYIANPNGYLYYGDNVSLNHLENAMGVHVDGAMSGGLFSGSVQAAYLQSAKNDSYRLNLNYLYQYAGVATFVQGSIGQGKAALTPVAESFAFGGDPVRFRKMCGDSFVSQMNAGVLLGVTVSLNFDSFTDKQAFKAAMKGKAAGIASIAATIKTAAINSGVNVDMSISALQLGGDPQDLNNIFGTNPEHNYPFFDCGTVPGACKDMMQNIITYGESIESQVSNPDGSINLEKMYYTNATTSKYSTLGITANAPDPSPAVLAAAQKLVKMYSDANFNYQFVRHYINTVGSYLTTASLGIMQDAKYHYRKQINDVYLNQDYNILECFRGYISNSCPQIEANVESALAQSPYLLPAEDTYLLNYFVNTIYTGSLYGYIGMGTDTPTDYQLQSCMFYPVSSAFNAQYVISCTQDTFFPITSGFLSITQSTLPNGNNQVEIDGLQYGAINPLYPSYQAQINYPGGLILNVNPEEPNNFGVTNISVTGGTSFSISTARLSLFQLPKNEN